jgi:hypothetical protein
MTTSFIHSVVSTGPASNRDVRPWWPLAELRWLSVEVVPMRDSKNLANRLLAAFTRIENRAPDFAETAVEYLESAAEGLDRTDDDTTPRRLLH